MFAPTMTGLGERSHLLDAKINLATHVTDIVNVIKWEGLSDIVLVGHSYGGLIISGVAEQMREAIGSIVFLDAFVPESGDSVADKASQPVREAIAALVQKGDSAMKPVPAAVFRVNEKDRAWVDGKCTPHPIATLTEKITVTGAHERVAKKAYIRAKGYPSIPFDGSQAKLEANPAWRSLRAAVRPRRHGRHARPADGDLAGSGVAPRARLHCGSRPASLTICSAVARSSLMKRA